MKLLLRELSFAVLAWFIPFVMSVCIFHLKRSHPAMFESAMGITLVGSIVGLGCLYLRRGTSGFVLNGVRIGLTWMMANWLLDGLMFSAGPMRMSLQQYLNEIAGAYLMIPLITVGLAAAAAQATRARSSS
jgi:hypothetical protein